MKENKSQFTYKMLLAFFLPLGLAQSLTSITHVIINGTLSRGENAAFIVASYAVAFSIYGIIEKPMLVFRQTSSALVTNKQSIRALTKFFIGVTVILIFVCVIIAYTPVGGWVFIHWFNASEDMVQTIADVFKVIMFVIFFSGIRGLHQGVIINHFQTKWLTVMVVVRLITMFMVAFVLVTFDFITSIGGAFILLSGMMVECIISVWKGKKLMKRLPESNKVLKTSQIFQFYSPIVFYFVFQTLAIPIIYIYLAKTNDMELGIASFALAHSVTNMVLSFFMYSHQVVLQFYTKHSVKVIRFMIGVCLIPSMLIGVLSFTSLGEIFMKNLMGADAELTAATIEVLKLYMIKTLVFPWIDFLNGFLMLKRKTQRMIIAQSMNLLVTVVVMVVLVRMLPEWNGKIGSLAVSLGEVVALATVGGLVYSFTKKEKVATSDKKGYSYNQ
ncbi:multi antimicrobial extrusion protein MatE [Aquibacillus salsiterrae]|uniref:Multi antimicrobial extrusion protein MatE n=1 Tax=Aquibacillus salsiterrae TaxID=2950439 RepID=A0A9X3WAZ3_9BACI|nr:multi antimicrobial extrusion protein MatE [Aquibacillus salsiterrae]MDC3416075.1 multi antimicrobial extrusion protein MatE [Aquibacillus salsiterrae]